MATQGQVGLLALAMAFSLQRAETTSSVEGVVVRAGTNQPIVGATVELTGIAPRKVEGSQSVGRGVISVSVLEAASDGRVLSFTTTTRDDGKFEIRDVPPGTTYQLIAVHPPEYLPAQYGQRVPAVPGHSLTLNPGDQLRDVRLEMTPGGTISGRVVDSRGLPVRNVVVELRRPWYLEGWRLLVDWNQVIQRVKGVGKTNRAATQATNARGEFNFFGLPPAQYYIRTSFSDDASLSAINLHAGDTISDVRIIAPEPNAIDIRGVIFDPDGLGARSARVAVFRSNTVPLYETAVVDSQNLRPNWGGQFALTVPRPGKYFVLATGPAANGQALVANKEVEVRDFGMNDVHLQLTPSFSMSGRVTFEGGTPPSASASDALSFALYPTTMNVGAMPFSELPTSGGAFTLRSITPGDYRVEVRPVLTVPPSTPVPAGLERAYVKSVRLNGKDILNSGVRLEGPTAGSIEVVINMNGGTLEGRVLDAAGKPVPNVNAVIVPNAARRRRGDLYKFSATDDAGSFELQGLAPGEYKIFAWERVEDGAWQDPEFIRLYENSGSPVRVEENRRTKADTRLIPAWN